MKYSRTPSTRTSVVVVSKPVVVLTASVVVVAAVVVVVGSVSVSSRGASTRCTLPPSTTLHATGTSASAAVSRHNRTRITSPPGNSP